MAKSGAVWGIEIGQCSLKALRCAIAEDGQALSALAFDHIEYPQILSQADADPVSLVREALTLFLSRNEVRGDRVIMGVPGQSGLVRFIKLPPVESKKLAAIVSYEAKQQIPFPLEEVIWDYQKMPGGSEEEGFSLETEVGLFAMKRDQVFRAIKPLETVGIELDIVQLAPLALYNFAVFDQMTDLPPPVEYDPENPPDSIALISAGTDSTDLVVTNGYRVWQRSIPLGGSHFTRQLTKELKLTFGKAEHLKRNAHEAQDSKAIFQAMRPIFKEFVTELQRSIGYFESLDRNANISNIIVLGNAFKLLGLEQYVEKSLGIPLKRFEQPQRLTGSSVVSTPAFAENALTFPVCYGLCVQGLGQSQLHTNLVPPEIIRRRVIRQKKPWVVCAVAALLMGLMCHYFFTWNAWSKVRENLFSQVLINAKSIQQKSQGLQKIDEEKIKQYEDLKTIGDAIVMDDEGRRLVLELLKAIYTALPTAPNSQPEDAFQRPYDERPNLYVERVDSQFFSDLTYWWNEDIENHYLTGKRRLHLEEDPSDLGDGESANVDSNAAGPLTSNLNGPQTAGTPNPTSSNALDPNGVPITSPTTSSGTGNKNRLEGPKGKGWVFELTGYHFYNSERGNKGHEYVRNTLILNLLEGTVELPDGPDGTPVDIKMEELGIRFPVLIFAPPIYKVRMHNPEYTLEIAMQERELALSRDTEEIPVDEFNFPPKEVDVSRCDFVVQFCWQETSASKRFEQRLEKEQKENEIESRNENTDAMALSGVRKQERQ